MFDRDFSKVSANQLGRVSEYIARIEFARRGYTIFVPEIDDKGFDILIHRRDTGYRRVQVKSKRGYGYVFMRKSYFYPQEDFDLFLITYLKEKVDMFVVPSTQWLTPCAVFCDRDYENRTSKPEYGVNISRRNYAMLNPFRLKESQHLA